MRKRRSPRIKKQEESKKCILRQLTAKTTVIEKEPTLEIHPQNNPVKTYSNVKRIKKEVTNFRNFHSCTTCHYQTKSPTSIFLHRKLHWIKPQFTCSSIIPNYRCNNCELRTNFFVILNNHFCPPLQIEDINPADINPPQINPAHFCESCNFETHSKVVLMKHMLTKCDKTGGVLNRTIRRDYYKCWQFLIHIRHLNFQILKCENCNITARLEGNIGQHLISVHSRKSTVRWYECELCLINIKRIFHLRHHVLVEHTTEYGDNISTNAKSGLIC